MCNGLLPFRFTKHNDGVPVPHPETYSGLLLAFRLAAEGKSDRDVADTLNSAGYLTTGNRGPKLFTKDTACRIFENRFYLGDLPDDASGWLPGRHQPVLDRDLFDAAQAARAANVRGDASVKRTARTGRPTPPAAASRPASVTWKPGTTELQAGPVGERHAGHRRILRRARLCAPMVRTARSAVKRPLARLASEHVFRQGRAPPCMSRRRPDGHQPRRVRQARTRRSL
jgi:hypothetical protein